jgi:hypothetical protein
MFTKAASFLFQRPSSIVRTAALSRSRLATISNAKVFANYGPDVSSTRHSVIQRQFSDSHGDFAPKRKVVEGEDEALKLIQEHVDNNPIMLYMKGNPSMPMCKHKPKIVIENLHNVQSLTQFLFDITYRWILGSSGESIAN